jgi:hypothetical protein
VNVLPPVPGGINSKPFKSGFETEKLTVGHQIKCLYIFTNKKIKKWEQ